MWRAARFAFVIASLVFATTYSSRLAGAQTTAAPKPRSAAPAQAAAPSAPQPVTTALAAAAATPETRPGPVALGLSDYTGTLDGSKHAHFTLIAHPDGSITGSYFLLSSLKAMTFTGKAIDTYSFSARVANTRGTDLSPYLYLKADKSHAVGEWLSGSLYGDGGANQHSVSIQLVSSNPAITSEADRYTVAGAKDAAMIEKNAQSFWLAVTSNQPEQAAVLISYPLAYTESGRRTLLHTPADFQKKFPAIFTPAYVAQLKSITPKAMVANWQGIKLGCGQIWFNDQGKAFALNNEPVKMYAGKRFLSNAGWIRGASHQPATSQSASGSKHDTTTSRQ